MGFIGVQPATVPLTSSDITDGIISTAKIADDAVGNTKLDLTADYAFTGTITGAGKILQILQDTSTAITDISSGATASAVVSQAITPSSTSNKILVNISINIGGVNNAYGHGQLKRGSTLIGTGVASSNRAQASFGLMSGLSSNFDYRMAIHNFMFLDSPSTTSATTYSVDLICTSGGMNLNRSNNDGDSNIAHRGMSTITVIEVVA